MPFLAVLDQLTAAPLVPRGTATLSGTLSASSLSSRTTLTAGPLKNMWPNDDSDLQQHYIAAKEKLMEEESYDETTQNTR